VHHKSADDGDDDVRSESNFDMIISSPLLFFQSSVTLMYWFSGVLLLYPCCGSLAVVLARC